MRKIFVIRPIYKRATMDNHLVGYVGEVNEKIVVKKPYRSDVVEYAKNKFHIHKIVERDCIYTPDGRNSTSVFWLENVQQRHERQNIFT